MDLPFDVEDDGLPAPPLASGDSARNSSKASISSILRLREAVPGAAGRGVVGEMVGGLGMGVLVRAGSTGTSSVDVMVAERGRGVRCCWWWSWSLMEIEDDDGS